MQVENTGTTKQNLLNDILKRATEYLLATNYEKSIPLYEYALKLINEDPSAEEFDLYEIDVCAIEYALCKCYMSNKVYFEKANEEIAPLVLSYGKLFPNLYFVQASLYLQKGLYDKSEKCISEGSEALLNIGEKGVFRTNWPGTQIQIPESNTDVLLKLFKNLRKQCNKQRALELNASQVNVTNSVPIPKVSVQDAKILKKEPNESGLMFEKGSSKIPGEKLSVVIDSLENLSITSTENVATCNLEGNDAELVDMKEPKNPEICKVISGTTLTWKVDVPEFVPQSFKVDRCTPEPCNHFENVYTGDRAQEKLIIPGIDKGCQTSVLKSVERCTQIKVKTSNASFQTQKCEEAICQKCISIEKDKSAIIKVLENENKNLQKKIKHLKEELTSCQKRTAQEQLSRQALEQLDSINNIKLEVQLEVITDKCNIIEGKYEEELNKNKMLTSMFMMQLMRNNNMQRLVLNKHVERCKSMISSLLNVQGLLTLTSLPTLDTCQKHIHFWQVELDRTQHCLYLYQEYQELILTDFNSGSFGTLREPPEFSLSVDEPRNILQDNFQTAVVNLLRELRHYQVAVKKYHDDYYHWWNSQGKFVYQQPQPQLAAPPLQNFCPPHPAGAEGLPLQMKHSLNEYNSSKGHAAPVNTITDKKQPIYNPSTVLENESKHTNVITKVVKDFEDTEQTHDAETQNVDSFIDIEKNEWCWNPESEHVAVFDLEKVNIKTDNLEKKELHLETDVSSSCPLESEHPEQKRSPIKLAIKHTKLLDNHDVVSKLTDNILENAQDSNKNSGKIKKRLIAVRRNANIDANIPKEDVLDTVIGLETQDKLEVEKVNNCIQTLVESEPKPYLNSFPTNCQNGSSLKGDPMHNNTNGVNKYMETLDVHSTTKSNSSSANNDLINLNQLLKKDNETTQCGVSLKALGGPKFYSLFCYVRSKIPNTKESDIWNALSAVKQKRVKLSGMTKDSIVAAVQIELISAMEMASVDHSSKDAWGKVNNVPLKWNKEQQDTSCVICIEPFEGMQVTSLKCDHKFHTDCIRKWFSTNCICPVCRIHATVDEDFPPLGSPRVEL